MKNYFRLYTSGRSSIRYLVRPILARGIFQRPFGDNARRVLFTYFPNDVGVSQIDPFFYYYSKLKSRFDVEFRALSLREFVQSDRNSPRGADFVLLQTWYDLSEEERDVIFGKINKYHPDAKLIYLDWFSPLDLRLAEFLDDKVTLYVKKQIFRDFAEYKKTTFGATNLVDYYARLFDLSFENTNYDVPESFEKKIVVGPGFFTSRNLIDGFLPASYPDKARPIDLNARITTQKSDWYGMMRNLAHKAAKSVQGRRVVTEFGLSRKSYIAELRRSKLCFSPFGYGEVCWRDFEAMMTGSLLLKPDVSHLITDPNVFVPGETYVPLLWDYSDLAEKVDYYLRNEDERKAIATRAYQTIHDYLAGDGFMQFAESVFSA